MDLSQVVSFAFAHARWLGLAFLAAGIGVRLAGRALSRVLLAAGILAAAGVAYQEWQAMHSLLVAAGILVAGAMVFGLLAWTVRGISFLFAFVLVAAAFYLLAFGWLGPSFANSTVGSLTWAGATILTMMVTGLRGAFRVGTPVAALGGGLVH